MSFAIVLGAAGALALIFGVVLIEMAQRSGAEALRHLARAQESLAVAIVREEKAAEIRAQAQALLDRVVELTGGVVEHEERSLFEQVVDPGVDE